MTDLIGTPVDSLAGGIVGGGSGSSDGKAHVIKVIHTRVRPSSEVPSNQQLGMTVQDQMFRDLLLEKCALQKEIVDEQRAVHQEQKRIKTTNSLDNLFAEFHEI